MIKNDRHARGALVSGVFAGIAAGLFLTLLMIATYAARGGDMWHGVKLAAVPFLGERARAPGFDFTAINLGLAMHLLVAVVWAVPFAFLVYGLTRRATLIAGVLWGFVVWLGMTYVVLPHVGLASIAYDVPFGRSIAMHVFFSVMMTLSLMLYQRFVYGARKLRQRNDQWPTRA